MRTELPKTAKLRDLRSAARGREPDPTPTDDELDAALGRITKAIEGKPTGKQIVEVGRNSDGSPRYGHKQYMANVLAEDVIAVGAWLKENDAHDKRTMVLYAGNETDPDHYGGARGCKRNTDGTPRQIQQVADELDHMLGVVRAKRSNH